MTAADRPFHLFAANRAYVPAREDGGGTLFDQEQFVRQAFAESRQKGMEGLFRLYYAPLCSHALRFVYSREVAEDLVSDVLYQFWKTGSDKPMEHSYRAYLYAAVRHRAFNYLRDELKGNRRPESLDAHTEPVQTETPQTLIEYDETFQRIEREIHALPTQCRRVFLMSRFEGRKNQEIADELGLALKTVEAHMARALIQLRRVFLPIGLLLSTLWS